MRWRSDVSSSAATPKGKSWPWLGWLAVLALVVCSVWLISSGAFFAEGRVGFTLFDDAMISMRYAQNLSDHGKLIWSEASGQTEGFTNFGWMLLMAVAYKLFGLYVAPLAVSILALSFLLAGTWVLAESDTKFRSLGWPMILCALLGSFSLVFWSIRGFEVALIFFLQACLYVTALARPKQGMGLVLCIIIFAGVFTRDDFAITTLIFLVMLIAQAMIFKRAEVPPGKQIFIFAVILAAVAVKTSMRFIVFGAMLPNTYYLKVEGHNKAVMLLRGLVSTALDGINYLWLLLLLLLLMLIIYRQDYWRLLIKAPVEWASHALILSCILYSILVGADAWQWSGLANRFIAPVTPFMLMNALLFLKKFPRSALEAWPTRREIARMGVGLPLILLAAMAFNGVAAPILIGKTSTLIDGLRPASNDLILAIWLLLIGCMLIIPIALNSSRSSWVIQSPVNLAALYFLLIPLTLIGHSILHENGNLLHVRNDALEGQKSIESRSLIPAGTTVISKWAGTYPYYRPDVNFVDPLGKMDSVISHSKPKWRFYPGHTKWNYAYSISRFKPDFIRGKLTEENKDGILRDQTDEYLHYFQLTPELMKRRDEPGSQ